MGTQIYNFIQMEVVRTNIDGVVIIEPFIFRLVKNLWLIPRGYAGDP